MPKHFWQKPYLWLIACAALSLFVLAYPLYVIRPFRYQGPRELAAALSLLQVRLYLEIALAVLSVLLLVWTWKRIQRPAARVFAAVLTFATAGFAVLSHVNVYEMMFRPVDQPVFASISRTKLDGAEQVIAIKLRNAARAYPIRQISYHHIVNDQLAGLPVVATY